MSVRDPSPRGGKSFEFDSAVLLNDHGEERVSIYLQWFKALTKAAIITKPWYMRGGSEINYGREKRVTAC
jgi:hypothetical protein